MSNLNLIDTYRRFLQEYSPEQLKHIPEHGVWSVGQMYDHLIVVAHEYMDSVETCEKAVEEQNQGKTDFGDFLFNIGGFPPIKIELPPELNTPPDNTKSKEDIMLELDQLMIRMKTLGTKVNAINPNFKSEHGGFGWLNA